MRATLRVGSAIALAICGLTLFGVASIVLVVPLNRVRRSIELVLIIAIAVPRALFGTQMLPVNSRSTGRPTPRYTRNSSCRHDRRGEVFTQKTVENTPSLS